MRLLEYRPQILALPDTVWNKSGNAELPVLDTKYPPLPNNGANGCPDWPLNVPEVVQPPITASTIRLCVDSSLAFPIGNS